MKNKTLLAVLALATVSGAAWADSSTVFTWKTRRSTAYSDTPRNMQMGTVDTLNVRTGTISAPPTAEQPPANSIADQQAQLNQKIAEENKRIEEANAKAAADTKAENCKAAQMNKQTVERNNVRNKDELLPKYEADIAKYCS